MSNTANFDSFRNTTEVATGFSSLFNNGSAIVAGSEPTMTPNMNFGGNWTIEFFVKVLSNTSMCLMSIPDGTGNRYFDVYIEGATIKTYYEGTTDTLTYTTDTTPLTEWMHVAVCYNGGSNLLYTACDPDPGYAAGNETGQTINRTVTADPSVANTTVISLFKPVHADADYFNGYIGALRVRTNYFNYSAATYNITTTQAEAWDTTSGYAIASLDPVTLTATQTDGPGTVAKGYHSWTKFDDSSAIVCSADVWGGRITKRFAKATSESNFTALYSISGSVAAGGSHYYAATGLMLTVDRDTDDVRQIDLNGVAADVVDINNGGYYYSGRGDADDTYFFGFKKAADNTTHQLFRMDPDGTNEITVDISSLTGVNEKVYGIAINDDDQLIYFHDHTTAVLRSVAYDLSVASFVTYNLTLQPGYDRGDMDYSQGYLFYGGTGPVSGNYNSFFYRFDIATQEIEKISGPSQSIRGGPEGTIDMFIHRPLNRLWVSGENKNVTIVGTNFDFFTTYMFQDAVTLGGVTISWTPVTGATHYNLLQDGVIVASALTTTVTTITGLGTAGTSYKFTLEDSSDNVTYTTTKYYKYIHTAASRIVVQEDMPHDNWSSPQAVYGALDPYDPVEFVLDRNNRTYKFNVETDVETELRPYRIQASENLAVTRGWGNKKFFIVPNAENTKIYDMGVECGNLDDFTNQTTFLASTDNLVFTASEQIRCITSLFAAKQIYYGISTGIRRVNMDGTGDIPILTTTAYVRGIGIDPHNENTIVYTSGNRLYYYSISADTSTDVTNTTVHGNTHDLQVLNGRIYGQYYNRPNDYGMFSVDINGDDYFGQGFKTQNGGAGWSLARQFLMNHEDNTMISIDRTFTQSTMYDAGIGSLPADPSMLVVRSNPIGIKLEWSEHPLAVKFGVSYSLGNDGDNTPKVVDLEIPVTQFTQKIRGTQPNTTYTVYFYYGDDADSPASTLITATTITTPAGSGGASDYETSFFAKEDNAGGFDLTTLSDNSFALISDILNDLFTSGDEIDIPVNGKKVSTKFVRLGETTQVEEGKSIALPFSTDDGAGQTASLTLSDASTVAVTFNETTEDVTVGSVTYSPGDSFVMDGKKVTIFTV